MRRATSYRIAPAAARGPANVRPDRDLPASVLAATDRRNFPHVRDPVSGPLAANVRPANVRRDNGHRW